MPTFNWRALLPPDVVQKKSQRSVSHGLHQQDVYELIEFIQACCHSLHLDQAVFATACTLYHQVFRLEMGTVKTENWQDQHQKSPRKWSIAQACVFLGAKVREDPRKLRDMINVVHYLTSHGDAASAVEANEEYQQQKESIIQAEQYVLRVLVFQIDISTPYPFLFNYAKTLECSPELVRIACTLINDAYFSSTCIAVPPYIIAVTCLYIAASSVPTWSRCLPRGPWWTVFDTTAQDIEWMNTLLETVYLISKK